jgi:hypothetical protein
MLKLLGRVMSDVIGKTSAQLDGIEADVEAGSFSEQNQVDMTAEDVQLKTIIDASGVSHICSARMKTLPPSRSTIAITVGVLKLEVNRTASIASLRLPAFFFLFFFLYFLVLSFPLRRGPFAFKFSIFTCGFQAECTTCGTAFSFWLSSLVGNRRHHCRHCFRAFCGRCSDFQAAVPGHSKPGVLSAISCL